jgi:hypothetical protein
LTFKTATSSSPAGPAATSSGDTPFTHDENNQTGLIVGVVIGALVAIALVAGLIFFFRRRFKSRGKASKTTIASTTSPNGSYVKHELSSDSVKNPSYVHSAPVEANGGCRRPEMEAPLPPPKERAEMEA